MRPKKNDKEVVVDDARCKDLADFLTEKAGWRRKDNFDAFDALYALVSKGCDGVFLVSMLEILANDNQADTWEGLTGFSTRDRLRTGLERLRVCANDIDHFLEGVIGRSLLQEPAELSLSDNLRRLADLLESAFESIKPQSNLVGRLARARIVQHVYEKTGHFCDELVATILTPALGACDAVNQGVWRSDNKLLMNHLLLKK